MEATLEPITEEQREMIEDCENASADLSDWESKFIDALSRCNRLAANMAQRLEQIWERVSP